MAAPVGIDGHHGWVVSPGRLPAAISRHVGRRFPAPWLQQPRGRAERPWHWARRWRVWALLRGALLHQVGFILSYVLEGLLL